MRRVDLHNLGMVRDPVARDALRELALASAEVDLTDISNAFTISGAYTPTRTLNVTTPTLANLVAFVATFIDDCKRGGTNRTT